MEDQRKSVRVFISSTFRDMHAERDHLITVVFPELRERLNLLGLDFYDVDLRWGVPEHDADGEMANSWEYCKQWIDEVEPFFIGLLGERYGWVPPAGQIKDESDRSRYVRQSITEMEMRYAAFDREKLQHRTLFYLRSTKVPKPPETAEATYREFVDTDYVAELERLKKLITGNCPTRVYPCTWHHDCFEDLDTFGEYVLEDLWSGVLRDRRYVGMDVWQAVLDHDPATDPRYTDETTPIPRDLWKQIAAIARPASMEPLDAEAREMDEFAAQRLRFFTGRTRELAALHDFFDVNAANICAVRARAGQGKSALLARLARELADRPEPSRPVVITHFVGATEGSADVRNLLLRLIREVDRKWIGATEHTTSTTELNAQDVNDLRATLEERLTHRSGTGPLVLILDGLNQLTSGHDLRWLPDQMRPDVRVIYSCIDDADAPLTSTEVMVCEAGDQLDHTVFEVGTLGAEEIRDIVMSYLREYCKELDVGSIECICNMSQAGNPLYLLTMLNELRALGGNDMNEIVPRLITEMESRYPTTTRLFGWVLERLEVFGARAVGQWCSYLALGREGMASRELADLLASGPGDLERKTALRIERGIRRYLQKRGGQLDFFHGQLRRAAEQRYLDASNIVEDSAAELHQAIAAYFHRQPLRLPTDALNARKLCELPYQQTRGEMWTEVHATLVQDLEFIEAKCASRFYELQQDYRDALGSQREPVQRGAPAAPSVDAGVKVVPVTMMEMRKSLEGLVDTMVDLSAGNEDSVARFRAALDGVRDTWVAFACQADRRSSGSIAARTAAALAGFGDQLYFEMGVPEQAVEVFALAISLDPENHQALKGIATAYVQSAQDRKPGLPYALRRAELDESAEKDLQYFQSLVEKVE